MTAGFGNEAKPFACFGKTSTAPVALDKVVGTLAHTNDIPRPATFAPLEQLQAPMDI